MPDGAYFEFYEGWDAKIGVSIIFLLLSMHSEIQPETVPRIFGLDVGDRRIGVAVSDELGLTAQPVLTIERRSERQDLKFLLRLLRRYACTQVVVGNPLHMSGDVSPQARKAQAFAHALKTETGVNVVLWDAAAIVVCLPKVVLRVAVALRRGFLV